MLKSLAIGVAIGAFVSVLFERRRRITNLVRARKTAVEPPAAAGPREETPTTGDVATADDLERLTRPELYRRAREAGIAGRSEMSKAQLIAALRAAGHGAH